MIADPSGDEMPDGGRRFDQLVVEVDRHAQQDVVTIRVHGEIDSATAPGLQGELKSVLSEDVQRLILDLTGVEFCDVSGLNLLLRVQSQLASRGGHLSVVAACRPLRIMVSVLGLEGRLPLSLPAAGNGARKNDGVAASAGARTSGVVNGDEQPSCRNVQTTVIRLPAWDYDDAVTDPGG